MIKSFFFYVISLKGWSDEGLIPKPKRKKMELKNMVEDEETMTSLCPFCGHPCYDFEGNQDEGHAKCVLNIPEYALIVRESLSKNVIVYEIEERYRVVYVLLAPKIKRQYDSKSDAIKMYGWLTRN